MECGAGAGGRMEIGANAQQGGGIVELMWAGCRYEQISEDRCGRRWGGCGGWLLAHVRGAIFYDFSSHIDRKSSFLTMGSNKFIERNKFKICFQIKGLLICFFAFTPKSPVLIF